MWIWIHKLGSPKSFYDLATKLIPWFGWLALLMILYGLYGGLIGAPSDYQQGDNYRIMYVHVPAAWMSMFIYMVIAFSSAVYLIWKITLATIVAQASVSIGASFTFITLVTGSLWGKPTWGTYWIWDARLTSELLLLFIYLGYIGLNSAIDDRRVADRACALLAVVCVVIIPIIHYSVVWWNTLHQGSSISLMGKSSIAPQMLLPLLIMAIGFKLYYGFVVLLRARSDLIFRERKTNWVKNIFLDRN